jgi:hypothetical protein
VPFDRLRETGGSCHAPGGQVRFDGHLDRLGTGFRERGGGHGAAAQAGALRQAQGARSGPLVEIGEKVVRIRDNL